MTKRGRSRVGYGMGRHPCQFCGQWFKIERKGFYNQAERGYRYCCYEGYLYDYFYLFLKGKVDEQWLTEALLRSAKEYPIVFEIPKPSQ